MAAPESGHGRGGVLGLDDLDLVQRWLRSPVRLIPGKRDMVLWNKLRDDEGAGADGRRIDRLDRSRIDDRKLVQGDRKVGRRLLEGELDVPASSALTPEIFGNRNA